MVCGNIVEMLHNGPGQLVCCGQPMVLQVEKTEKDELKEKHVPVATREASGLKVVVGSVPHPMEEKHYIEWIEVVQGENVWRIAQVPGKPAEALFECEKGPAIVREYCNLHGLWKTTV
jgi:superoxide reductase